jgi:4-amino-4-deoxy-L-arabinose transferase-like glycosyltransferase
MVGGLVGSFYALRLGSLCMAVASIPLVALLARKLFPLHRAVWLLAPAVIATVQIVNAQNSYVDNDGLTMVAGAALLLALLSSRGDLRPRKAALFGATLALALLTKATLAALIPALLIAMATYVIRRRPGLRTGAIWAAVAGGTSLAILLPFLIFNLTEYHAFSGARAAAALVKPIIGSTPTNLHGAGLLVKTLWQTLFIEQDLAPNPAVAHYQALWEWLTVLAVASALGGAVLRQRRDELAVCGWIVLSIPLGVVTLIILGFNQSGTEATVVARYLDCLLPLFAVLIAYGAVAVLGSRTGTLALLSVLVVGSFLEVTADRSYVRATYATDIIGHSVPVVEQSYADGSASLTSVRASAHCPVDAVALAIVGPAPSSVAVNGQSSTSWAMDGTWWAAYQLARPVVGNLTVRFPGPAMVATALHRGEFVSAEGRVHASGNGLPAVRLYCPVADPNSVRFNQLYPTNHPQLSEATLLAWPEVEAWVEVVLVAAVAVGVAISVGGGGNGVGGGRHRRRSRRTST